jgi:hypothetical protein
MASAQDQLRQLRHDIHGLHRELFAALIVALINHDPEERTIIMALADDINALGPRVDAIGAAFGTDIATAVANQKATDDAANAATIQELADAQRAVTNLTARVAVAETAAGIAPPAA